MIPMGNQLAKSLALGQDNTSINFGDATQPSMAMPQPRVLLSSQVDLEILILFLHSTCIHNFIFFMFFIHFVHLEVSLRSNTMAGCQFIDRIARVLPAMPTRRSVGAKCPGDGSPMDEGGPSPCLLPQQRPAHASRFCTSEPP